jgi:hypothetical protein
MGVYFGSLLIQLLQFGFIFSDISAHPSRFSDQFGEFLVQLIASRLLSVDLFGDQIILIGFALKFSRHTLIVFSYVSKVPKVFVVFLFGFVIPMECIGVKCKIIPGLHLQFIR